MGDSRTRGVELAGELVVWAGDGAALRAHTATSFYRARYTSGTVVADGANRSVVGNRVESVPTVMSRSGLAFEQGRRTLQLLVSYVGRAMPTRSTRAPAANGAVGLVPAYTLTDVNAAVRVARHARVRLGINNLFDRAYFTKRPQFYPGPGVWPSDGRGVQGVARACLPTIPSPVPMTHAVERWSRCRCARDGCCGRRLRRRGRVSACRCGGDGAA
ncbi:MAG: TonB-dependent receptor [Gemmatimonadetes bacterium]|nr:TonB-dependent receptor [Gemmatimonadota bacterium]